MNTAIMAMGEAQDTAQPHVSLVTALAEAGDLQPDEYREIYDRVAAGRSLRNIELELHSGVTFGWWAKYAAGEKGLDRDRKNELRRWARANGGPDLPDLPPTPVEAVAEHVHPDAAVYQVGAQIASRVVLVGADVEAVNLRINGSCTIDSPLSLSGRGAGDEGYSAPQPACNNRYSRKPGGTIHLARDTWERLNTARLRAGQTWDEFLARLEDVS